MEWNERNCHFDECDFVKEAKRLNQYAFCSDYYRLKALYEYGGIYLDTDIEVKKDIPSYLFYEKKCVFGFMYDNLVSTAFIMAEKGSPVIAGLLEFYERNEVSRTSANNDLYTRYLITKYPDLLLIGTAQQLEEGVVIYPKEWFECPTFKKNGGVLRTPFLWHLEENRFSSRDIQEPIQVLGVPRTSDKLDIPKC